MAADLFNDVFTDARLPSETFVYSGNLALSQAPGLPCLPR